MKKGRGEFLFTIVLGTAREEESRHNMRGRSPAAVKQKGEEEEAPSRSNDGGGWYLEPRTA